MRRGFQSLVALAAVLTAAMAALADDDVLYWMVDSNATVKNGDQSLESYFSEYGADSNFAARIRVTGGDIVGDTFLDIYYEDESGQTHTYSGEYGMDFDLESGSEYWGAGVPDGVLSPSGDYANGSPEYSFIIEIGNVVIDGEGNSSWTTIAQSAATAYNSLSDYIQTIGSLDPMSAAVWAPTEVTAVPEPSSGILVLMGTALMALRRKRSAA